MNRREIRNNYCDEKNISEFNVNWVSGYALWLETKLQEISEELSKLHQPTVISSVCEPCKYRFAQDYHGKMRCRDCQQGSNFEQTDL